MEIPLQDAVEQAVQANDMVEFKKIVNAIHTLEPLQAQHCLQVLENLYPNQMMSIKARSGGLLCLPAPFLDPKL